MSRSDATQPSGRRVECPRCGYDLRGLIGTWDDACPLEGCCSECGLVYRWEEAFYQARHPWLFDYQWKRRPVLATLLTILFALLPNEFWSRTPLATPFKPTPAFLFSFVIFALPWAIAMEGRGDPRFTVGYLALVFLCGWMPLCAGAFVLLPVSIRRAKVLPVHLWRIVAYGYAWAGLITLIAFGITLSMREGWSLPWRTHFVMLTPSWPPSFRSGPEANFWAAAIYAWPLLSIWWAFAVSRYLKIPHGFAVGVLLTALAGAVGYLILFVYDFAFGIQSLFFPLP